MKEDLNVLKLMEVFYSKDLYFYDIKFQNICRLMAFNANYRIRAWQAAKFQS